MKIITVANPKGGVSKSTLALHLAYRAAEIGKKVLVIDFDLQGSLSHSLLNTMPKYHTNTAAALFVGASIEPVKSDFAGIDILAASAEEGEILNDFSCNSLADLQPVMDSIEALKSKGSYDICIIDTAGVLGFKPPHTTAAMIVSDYVVIPTTLGDYEARSLAKSWQYISSIANSGVNHSLKIMGIIPCRINSKSPLEIEGLNQLRQALPQAVMPFELVERNAVKKAILGKHPVWKKARGESDRKAAKEWLDATNHIISLIK